MTDGPGPVQSEGVYSAPTELCPSPERWHSTDDESTEIEVSDFIGGLVRALQPSYVIETGSAWGQTAQVIGHALQRNGHGRLVSLEMLPERVAYTRQRCVGMPVEVVEGDSLAFDPTEPIDFAFFDSIFALRVPEFQKFSQNMRRGTIVAFHDTAPYHGVMPSGRDLRTEIEVELKDALRLIHLPTPRGCTVGEVL